VRIMVVDDEVLVRVGVKTIVPWERHGHQIVAEAENGARALELLESRAPDIALVDIRMPVMDGLELIARARAAGSRCKFIILTCLTEFRYAQEALKLGVRDYIIKTSMDSADLLRLIDQVSAEIGREREGTVRARAADAGQPPALEALGEALRAEAPDPAALLELLARLDPELAPPRLHALSIRILRVGGPRGRDRGGAGRVYGRGLLNVAGELFRQHGRGVILERDERTYEAFVALDRAAPDGALAELCRRLAETARTLLALELAIGAGGAIPDAPSLPRGRAEAVAARERLFFGGGQFMTADGAPPDAPAAREAFERDLKGLRAELFRAAGDLNLEACAAALDRLRALLAGAAGRASPADAMAAYRDAFYWLATQAKRDLAGVCEEHGDFSDVFDGLRECESLEEVHAQLTSFRECLSHAMTDREGAKARLLVERAREHVAAHLAEDLGLEEAARRVGLSPGYFGKLFKRETGSSFSEYLIRCRIERAKELMRGDEKLWSISQQIGYPDLSSFSRSFKRVTGISPSQFKERLAGDGDAGA
jgi:two-component system, response regulator YesN